jgi:predicted HD phosphohydrolase
MYPVTPTSIADTIIELYKTYGGNEYAGEKVTQLQHMIQAADLARR